MERAFFPLWTVAICPVKTNLVVDSFSQTAHLKGFLPSWAIMMCRFIWLLYVKSASHMLHLNGFSFSWTLETCNFRFCFEGNLLSHIVQLKDLSPIWIDAICLFKLGFCVKLLSQTVQSNVFVHELHQYEVSNLLCKGILDRKYGIHIFFLRELFQHVVSGSIFGILHHKDGTELLLV